MENIKLQQKIEKEESHVPLSLLLFHIFNSSLSLYLLFLLAFGGFSQGWRWGNRYTILEVLYKNG
jgi:hypothetical protein